MGKNIIIKLKLNDVKIDVLYDAWNSAIKIIDITIIDKLWLHLNIYVPPKNIDEIKEDYKNH